ncbi:MAG: helix-turn-helix transcriptional regulator [Bacteroidales bacterium]|jgi:transcriptional regulator with XRE-family HTH domain|nr:helix-turn-helix transcriptional regulator [Bacteroidales bacterium]MBR6931748.1 helix-turn-helix transcriptional regulator [Bacteroidales bacterium]
MNGRLQQFLDAENITQSQLADSLGVARAGISHILSGRNKPGFDFIEGLARKFPDLSIEWLITGKGRMYKSAAVSAPEEPEAKRIAKVVIFYDDNTFKEIF